MLPRETPLDLLRDLRPVVADWAETDRGCVVPPVGFTVTPTQLLLLRVDHTLAREKRRSALSRLILRLGDWIDS